MIEWRDKRWLVVAISCLAVGLLCTLLAGVETSARCGLFLFAALIPLGLGSLWIYNNFWWRPLVWGLLLEALLVGLVGFEVALLGIVLNPEMQAVGWVQKCSQAGLVGILGFLVVMLVGPLFLRIARVFRQ